MSPDRSLMVVCGDEVMVVAAHNAATVGDVVAAIGVAAADSFVVGVGAATVLFVWVQRC